MASTSGGKGSNASKLSAKTNAKRNTKVGREAMPSSDFALPAQKAYRIDDVAHARNALSRVAQDGTPAEQAQVRRAVARKYPSIQQSKPTPKGTGGGSKSVTKRTGK